MALITSGFRRILSISTVYNLFLYIIGADRPRRIFCSDYLKLNHAMRVLEIGCGHGNMIPFLPNNIQYEGYDLSEEYIRMANAKFANDKRKFYCKDVKDVNLPSETYDIVLCYGILHHLDDAELSHLLKITSNALKEGGKFLSLDSTYAKNQSRIAKWLVSKDRGQNVRMEDEYIRLCSNYFRKVKHEVRNDLLNIPYSVIMMEWIKEKNNK